MRRAAHPSALLICGLPVVMTLLLTPSTLPATSEPEKIETIRINLATVRVPTADEPVSTGIKKIEILNLAPRYLDLSTSPGPYIIKIARETTPVPPFDYSAIATAPEARISAVPEEGCTGYLRRLLDAKDLATAKGQREKRPEESAECARAVDEVLCEKLARELLSAPDEQSAAILLERNIDVPRDCDASERLTTRMVFVSPAYTVHRGDILTVTIERGVGETQRKWTRRYVAPAAQPFLVTYGLNFIPKNDHEYYAKPVPSLPAGTPPYVLTEKSEADGFDNAPSVFFSYPFPITKDRILALGPAAGLGFDLSAPVVFLGLGVIFNQNIHLVSGAVMQQQQQLRGEYSVGQPLTENLANDQLTQKTYKPSWFVGLSFRFSSNPFSSSTEPKKVAPE